VIDNGQDARRLKMAMDASPVPFLTYAPDVPMGVAESWNWFINNVPDDRILSNDDIVFGPRSLALMAASKADLVWAKGCGFSCFMIRDTCIEKLGYFDESISPGYGYYEDCDYLQRLDGKGTRERSADAEEVDAGIVHLKSQTLVQSTPEEMLEHHRKFCVAQHNYAKKWGVQF